MSKPVVASIPNVCFTPDGVKHHCFKGLANDLSSKVLWNIQSIHDTQGFICLPTYRDYANELTDEQLKNYTMTAGQEGVHSFLTYLRDIGAAPMFNGQISTEYTMGRVDYSDYLKFIYDVQGMRLYVNWFSILGTGIWYGFVKGHYIFSSPFGHMFIKPAVKHYPGSVSVVLYCEEVNKDLRKALYECLEQPYYLMQVLQYLFPEHMFAHHWQLFERFKLFYR